MKTKNLIKTIICLLTLTLTFGCSSDDSSDPAVDNRSFTLNSNTDYVINMDGTVNIIVTGNFSHEVENLNIGQLINQGIVFGTSSQTEVNANNTVSPLGNEFESLIRDLTGGTTYYARGYFQYDNGDYYYGDEIQISTDIDASGIREITLEIEPNSFSIGADFVTVDIIVSDLTKEIPTELGVEYSVNSDFTNSSTKNSPNYEGLYNSNGEFLIINTQVVAEPLLPATQYYFRPYVKYADNTVTNGGTSTASFTTN